MEVNIERVVALVGGPTNYWHNLWAKFVNVEILLNVVL
jgi:hypothetical protein